MGRGESAGLIDFRAAPAGIPGEVCSSREAGQQADEPDAAAKGITAALVADFDSAGEIPA